MSLLKIYLLLLIVVISNERCGFRTKIHENKLIAGKVIKVDTLSISGYGDSVNRHYPNFSKVALVHFELFSKEPKQFFIVTDLEYSDHICRYDFIVGKEYEFIVHKFKYANQDQVADVLKGTQFRANCETIRVKQ